MYILDYFEYADRGGAWTYRLVTSTGEWPGNFFEFFIRVSSRISVIL